VVSKIISPTMVNVMISDGFEIPVMTGELIPASAGPGTASMFDEEINVDFDPEKRASTTQQEDVNTDEEENSRMSPLVNFSFRIKNEPGIYLAYVPHDQKWLVTGELDVYLVNHSEYDVIFSLFLKKGESYEGNDYDVIPPHHKVLLDSIEREKLNEWQEGHVQLLFHTDEPDPLLKPVSQDFKVKTNRLVAENSYIDTEFIEERCLPVQIIALKAVESLPGHETQGKEGDTVTRPKKAEPKRPGAFIDKHRTSMHEAVVDLHIEELTDDHHTMNPHDILNFQLRYFEKCIESAIQANYHKITFIHGVGKGALKSALIRRLQEYENLENHSASLAKFGVGAIDVLIRPLK
jgi:hypothetical protein